VVQIAYMDNFGGLFIYNIQALKHESVPLDNIHTFKTPSSVCPNELTAMPVLKSKYFLPSTSQAYDHFLCKKTKMRWA